MAKAMKASEQAADFQPEAADPNEPAVAFNSSEVELAEGPITWRWARPADMAALRVCHFQSEVAAGQPLYLPEQPSRHELRKHIIDEGERGNWKPLYDARGQGLLDAEEARRLRHDVLLGPLAARVNHFKYSDFMKVFSVATPEEQKQLDPVRLRKRADLLKKGKRPDVVAAEAQ